MITTALDTYLRLALRLAVVVQTDTGWGAWVRLFGHHKAVGRTRTEAKSKLAGMLAREADRALRRGLGLPNVKMLQG